MVDSGGCSPTEWAALLVPALVVLSLICLTAAGVAAMPPEDQKPENCVPMAIAERIASWRANKEWGEVTRGPVIECHDLTGNVVCYVFSYVIAREVFPDYEGVLHEVKEGRVALAEALRDISELEQPDSLACRRLEEARWRKWGIGDYGTVTVSARYDLIPVPEITHGLHYFFSKGDLILEKAKEFLGVNARLVTIHYRTPFDQGYRFASEVGEVVIDPFSIRPLSEEDIERRLSWQEALLSDDRPRAALKREWSTLARQPVRLTGDHFLDYHDGTERTLLPCYLWTCGCAPTAAAMAIGYWDNYGRIGGGGFYKQTGRGRLIEYYLDEEALESYEACDQVNFKWECPGCLARPRLILDLALAMGTRGLDGATHSWRVSAGINRLMSDKGYGPGDWSRSRIAGSWNDWLWDIVTAEIGSNHPFVWAIQGHALCAWGYGDDGAVFGYNTWDEMRHDYDYRQCCAIYTVEPTGGVPGQDIELETPDGGDEFPGCEEVTVQWYQFGDAIDSVDLYWSSEGGHDTSWLPLVQDIPSNQGRNIYRLVAPNVDSRRVRVLIQGWRGEHVLYGSDGSRTNFSIEPVTPYVRVESPNGGECWLRTSQYRVNWDGCLGGEVRIDLFEDSIHVATIANRVPNTGSHKWLIPSNLPTGSEYYVQVASPDSPVVCDRGDGAFAVAEKIDIISPEDGKVCFRGEFSDITWIPSGIGGVVEIEYSTDGGSSWSTIAANEPDDGSYRWKVPNTVSTEGKLKIAHIICTASRDITSGLFDIWPRGVDKTVRYSWKPPGFLFVRAVFPNPVRDETAIEYHLSFESEVSVALFGVDGSLVRNLARGRCDRGWHSVDLDISDIPRDQLRNGLYLCVVRADGHVATRKIIVCR